MTDTHHRGLKSVGRDWAHRLAASSTLSLIIACLLFAHVPCMHAGTAPSWRKEGADLACPWHDQHIYHRLLPRHSLLDLHAQQTMQEMLMPWPLLGNMFDEAGCRRLPPQLRPAAHWLDVCFTRGLPPPAWLQPLHPIPKLERDQSSMAPDYIVWLETWHEGLWPFRRTAWIFLPLLAE